MNVVVCTVTILLDRDGKILCECGEGGQTSGWFDREGWRQKNIGNQTDVMMEGM